MNTSEIVEDILTHHGVKGQKWGVRRAEKRTARKEKRWERKSSSVDTKIELHNAIVKSWQPHLDKINEKWKDADLRDESSPAFKKYYNEVMDSYVAEVNKVAVARGASPSGKYTLGAVRNESDFLGFSVVKKEAKHADTDSFTVKVIRDSQGRIIRLELVEDSMTQSSIIDDILEHHGVKGMKWGVRRKATVGPTEVVVSDKRKKIKTKGGKGYPATESAVRARVIGQRAKKSGLKSLTDDELNAYAKRIQMEQNVSRLMYNEKSRGAKFVDSFLGRQGSQLANKAAQEGGAKLGRQVIKKSAKAAALAAA